VKPMLEVKSRRVGGSNYQVPVEVRPNGARRSGSVGSSRIRGIAPRSQCRRSSRTRSGRVRASRRALQEERRHAQDGGGQQRPSRTIGGNYELSTRELSTGSKSGSRVQSNSPNSVTRSSRGHMDL
jgi:hypothetical protein